MKKLLIQIFFILPLCFSSCALLSIDRTLDGKPFSQYTCKDFTHRGNDEKFSLRFLAQMRALQICKTEEEKPQFDPQAAPSWQQRLFDQDMLAVSLLQSPNEPPSVTDEKLKDKTAAEIKELIRLEKDNRVIIKLYKDLRQKYRNVGDKKNALKASSDLFKWAKSNWKKQKKDRDVQEIYQEAVLIRSRVLWNEAMPKQALELLALGLKDLKTLKLPADLYFLRGRIEEDQNKLKAARISYRLALENLEKQSSLPTMFDKEKILWISAWMAYRSKDWKVAETAMSELAGHLILNKKEIGEISRARFFQARSVENQGRLPDSTALFERIISEDFYSFYALASYHRLNRKFPPVATLSTTIKLPLDATLSFLTPEQKSVFMDLIKFEEFDYAERSIPFLTSKPYEVFQLSLTLAQNAKRYLPLFSAFARFSNEDKMAALIEYGDLIFPRVYEDKVKEMAEKTQVSSSLMYAIMKQESGFKERARSGADALGLMQVIPQLAGKLSKKYQVPYGSAEDLYNPHTNIQIGTYELKEQLQKQNGSLAFVAAAYNAGPNALARWLTEHKTDDIFEFIENIPYDETKSYVKIIARNKVFYERLKDRKAEYTFPKLSP